MAHLPTPTDDPDDSAAQAVPPCPQCGRDVPVMQALVYHGIVYHPECVWLGRTPPPPGPTRPP